MIRLPDEAKVNSDHRFKEFHVRWHLNSKNQNQSYSMDVSIKIASLIFTIYWSFQSDGTI